MSSCFPKKNALAFVPLPEQLFGLKQLVTRIFLIWSSFSFLSFSTRVSQCSKTKIFIIFILTIMSAILKAIL